MNKMIIYQGVKNIDYNALQVICFVNVQSDSLNKELITICFFYLIFGITKHTFLISHSKI